MQLSKRIERSHAALKRLERSHAALKRIERLHAALKRLEHLHAPFKRLERLYAAFKHLKRLHAALKHLGSSQTSRTFECSSQTICNVFLVLKYRVTHHGLRHEAACMGLQNFLFFSHSLCHTKTFPGLDKRKVPHVLETKSRHFSSQNGRIFMR